MALKREKASVRPKIPRDQIRLVKQMHETTPVATHQPN